MFWPFTVWISCASNLKKFENSRPSALNFKFFSRSIEHFFLKVGQNNFGNKLPKLRFQNDFDPPLWLRKAEENVLKDPEFMAILLSRHFSSHLGCAKLFHSNYHGSRRIISCLGTVIFRGMGQVVLGSL